MGLCLIIKSGGGTDTSSATASAEQILSGYTIYKNDAKVTGTMTNVGKQTKTGLNAGGSATISAGWHDGSGSVTTNSLSSQTGGTSIAVGDVLSGYTYWSSGAKATGTMASRGTKAWTIGVNGSQTIESGWHSGSGTVKQSSTVVTNSTKTTMTPTTSQQTLCNASTYYSQERWCAGNSNLTAANIKKDITIFGVKGTWYTNTRSLIENGKSTGLCTIAKTGAGTSSLGTLSWGGSSWWPLYGISQLGSGNTGTTFNVVTRIDGVSKIASLSWSGSTTSQSKYASVTFGFWVCGDILIDAWGWTSNPSFRMEVLLYVSGEWCSGAWSSTATWMPATATAHTYTTATIPAMSSVTTTKGQYMVAWTDGASTGSIFIYMMRPNTGVSPSWVNFGYTIWAKNLWLDTSHTVSV